MALDLNKYRALFLEEATDHLGEISRALLDLEKAPDTGESIDTIFRMAHSIKSMAASLGYDGISELSHALEDRMERVRRDGRVDSTCLGLLFRGLEQLETMVDQVRATGEAPASADAGLLEELSAPPRADHVEGAGECAAGTDVEGESAADCDGNASGESVAASPRAPKQSEAPPGKKDRS